MGQESPAAQPAPGDRRKVGRFTTIFRVGLLSARGERELCLVRNLSSLGTMVRAYGTLGVGEKVRIELKSGHPLEGQVLWSQGRDLGIGFAEPIDVEATLASQWVTETGQRPRLPRIETSVPLKIRVGARLYRGQLCDISPGGAKILGDAELASRASVVIMLPDLSAVAGTVCWVQDKFAGIVFNEPIPFETLATWLAARRNKLPCGPQELQAVTETESRVSHVQRA